LPADECSAGAVFAAGDFAPVVAFFMGCCVAIVKFEFAILMHKIKLRIN
jgi:hypothetical protein